MFGIKHAIRAMKSRGCGSIINTSSLAGISPGLAVSAYAVAKAAVVQLGKYAAAEAAPHGIRINTLCPGFIATPVFGNLVHADRALADKMVRYYQDEFAQFQPLPKSGLPIDIAKAALFLASDDSAFITGTEFVVDGGALIQSRVKPGPAATASLYQVLERAKAKALAES
jgi:NAD(P)-dependent dehydrogenase (short-subunit alcohol dehydrogenase family)